MIYIIVFAALIAACAVAIRLPQIERQLYWTVLVSLFLFSAFRFEVGCDWSGYENQFFVYSMVPLQNVFSEQEPMWVAIFSIQNWFGLSYPWINVISSLIFFAGAHAMAKRQMNPLTFIALLYPVLIINMPMSGIRQGAAIGVMFFAFNAFVDKAFFRYILLVTIAASLHQSALIFMLLAPLVSGNYSRTRIAGAVILAIPGIILLVSSSGAELANTRYIESDRDAAGAAFRVAVGVVTGIYFLIVLRRPWRALFDHDFKLAHVGAVAMLAIVMILPLSTIIADRVAYYLIPIQGMIFSRIPNLASRRDRKVQILAPYIGLFTMLTVWITYSSHAKDCYSPYQSWLLYLSY